MTGDRYALIQRLLHWLIALLVIGALAGGQLLDMLGDGAFKETFGQAEKNTLYFLHKSAGITILLLMLCRIVARLAFGAPPLPVSVAGWQATASGLVHLLFYILLIAMPLVGWAATSAFDAPLPVFGLFEMPKLLAKDRELASTLFEVHAIMGKVIFALAVIHIGAALMHGFKKDGVFRRIWF